MQENIQHTYNDSSDVTWQWDSYGKMCNLGLCSLKNPQKKCPLVSSCHYGQKQQSLEREGAPLGNSWCIKIQTWMKLATSSWQFFSLFVKFTQLLRCKLNFRDNVASQVELGSNHDPQAEDKCDLTSYYIQALFCV